MWLSASDQAAHFASTTATTSPTTGALTVAGGIGASGIIYGGSNIVLGGTGAAGTGALFFGNSGSKFLTYDGSNVYTLSGGLFQGGSGYQCRAGQSAGGYGTNVFNLYYPGVQLWIDVTNLGNITVTSDYRIKKDVLDLPGMWDTVKALRPIKYTQADFTPPAQIEHNAKLKAEGKEVVQTPMFVADTIERWGFIAHELQETLVESAATGVKDSPDHVQSPNMATVVAALTKALQEAMARIEALEAK
jgi:hypothetical protein